MKYGLLISTKLNITIHINNNDHQVYETLWNNFKDFADYLFLNKYRNIKLLLNSLKQIRTVQIMISFKYNYGNDIFDKFLKNDLVHIMKHQLPQVICKNPNLINNLYIIHNSYGNHSHFNKFVEIMGNNLMHLTVYNVKNIFTMFVLTQLNKFIGFQSWGPGNNKTPELNVISHYKKHVVNNKNENWKKYLLHRFEINKYKNFAIEASRVMTNKCVHTNGVKVYLSGLYDNNVLIIGRLDSNDMLGISSCYIISDQESFRKKMQAFENNICFKF